MNARYLPLFVYGTMQPDTEGYLTLLEGAVIEHAPAYWKHASLYVGPAYPLAIPSHGGTGIYGQVLLIDQSVFEELLDELDDFEGYLGEGRTDNLLLRTTARVEVFPDEDANWSGSTQDVVCYAYIAAPETIEYERDSIYISPSGRWNAEGETWDELAKQ